MNKNHSDQSLNQHQHQHFKTANSKVDDSGCEAVVIQTELAVEESLNTEDLSHVVGGAYRETSHLANQAVLPPPDRDDSPFEPSPTYPPLPNTGIPPNYSPKE